MARAVPGSDQWVLSSAQLLGHSAFFLCSSSHPAAMSRSKPSTSHCMEPIPTMKVGSQQCMGRCCPLGFGLISAGLFPVGSARGSARLCVTLAFPALQLLHSAASLPCRLEAATAPATSDSYSDRASSRSSAYSRRENRLAALSSRAEEESNRDYKKVGFLYVMLSLAAPQKLHRLWSIVCFHCLWE